jgi:exopolyphosphatase/guanosine-5'-triphosphate,3'-diphosphate pyrophosphatase
LADARVNTRFASLDIGSHTIRMLIAKLGQNREVFPVRVDRRITRLAEDFSKGDTLKKNSMDESISALIEFSSLLHRHQVRSVNCGATGVLRRAGNTLDFMERVR